MTGQWFPMFFNMEEKKIQVFGGGKIAARRIRVLTEFARDIRVMAPEVLPEIEALPIFVQRAAYQRGCIGRDMDVVLACTDSDRVNEEIYRECKEKKILVNVCSNHALCDFYFPGIAKNEDVVVGVCAGGKDHALAKNITEKIRNEVL